MFSDIESFYSFWIQYRKLCKQEILGETNREKGFKFEIEVISLLNKHFGYTVSGGGLQYQCRGVNKHQFDVSFSSNKVLYLGECKYTTHGSGGLSYIKTGLSKFVFASFQRAEYLKQLEKDTSDIQLILFSNIRLNKEIINDCFFNNVIFINPFQPYIPLALYLFRKRRKSLQKYNNAAFYAKLESYNNTLFNFRAVTRNTTNLTAKIVEDYFAFIRLNSLEYAD